MTVAMTRSDPVTAFLDAMAAAGCAAAGVSIVPDGKLHRFDIVGRRKGSEHGWYKLHLDGVPAGAFGDWREGITHTWCAKTDRRMTAEERTAFKRQMEESRAEAAKALAAAHAEARKVGKAVYDVARPAEATHPYLARKGVIAAACLRVDREGRLVVPVKRADGVLVGVQTITADGTKRFTKGLAKKGAYASIGALTDTIAIAEGYATAASVHMATGWCCVIAFDAGNLLPVAEAIKAKYPDKALVIAADNDHGVPGNPGLAKGRAAAEAVSARFVSPPEGSPGTDFNDLHAAAGLDAVATALRLPPPNVVPFPGTDSPSGMDIPGPDYDDRAEPPGEPLDEAEQPLPGAPIPLGYDHGHYFYLSSADGQIHELTASQHTQMPLMALASQAHFWERSRFMGKRGVAWTEAADWLMDACRAVGVYRADRLRGRGAYLEGDRVVLHLGDRAIVDGETMPLSAISGRHVYEAAPEIEVDLGQPLSAARARRVLEVCDMLPLETSWMATLLAGWIVIAPVCGAMPWRPHLWVVGERGSGKTYIIDEIVKPLVGKIALSAQGITSEAGIRQTLGSDARPVIVDEAEGEDEADRRRIQQILFLARQASSAEGAPIVKGTTHGKATSFRIRSVFCFSSINIGVSRAADESRMVTIALAPRDPSPEAAERFEEIRSAVAGVREPGFAGSLLARTLRALPAIRANAETFARAWVAEGLGSRRQGDTYGALLAGAYSLGSTRPISFEDAREFLRARSWVRQAAETTETDADHERALRHLLEQSVRHKSDSGAPSEQPIVELIAEADESPRGAASRTLAAFGLKVDGSVLWLAQGHARLTELFAGTPWAMSWRNTLLQTPGSRKSQPSSIRFGHHATKAISLPMEAVIKRDQ
jgi:putative DNA primase/helicase